MQFEDPPAPNNPSGLRMESGEEATAAKGSDLEEPPELGLEVASFLRGLLGTSKDEGDGMPLEPAVTEFSQWVPWRADKCKTPYLVGRVIGSARDRGPQKACQGGVGLILAPTADERIRNEGGQLPGSSHATMPSLAEVYAASPINLCMQGY